MRAAVYIWFVGYGGSWVTEVWFIGYGGLAVVLVFGNEYWARGATFVARGYLMQDKREVT